MIKRTIKYLLKKISGITQNPYLQQLSTSSDPTKIPQVDLRVVEKYRLIDSKPDFDWNLKGTGRSFGEGVGIFIGVLPIILSVFFGILAIAIFGPIIGIAIFGLSLGQASWKW